MTTQPYLIRPATPQDASASAHLIFLAGTPLFQYLFYKDPSTCEAFIAELFAQESNVFTYENATLQVNVHNDIVGLIYCVDRETEAENEAGTRDCFMKHFGLGGALLRLPRFRKFAEFSGVAEQDELFINHVAVHEDFRRQGIAHRLLEWAEQEAKQRGLRHLGLYVDFHNKPARRAYEAFGFAYTQHIEMNIKIHDTLFHGQDRMQKKI